MFESYAELIEINEYVSVSELVENGLDVTKPDSDGVFILNPACEQLKIGLVKELVKYGADVNSKSSDGYTPLLSVIECCHHDSDVAVSLIEFLLDNGADIELRGEWDKTPFLKACTRGQIDVVRLLVNRGCDISAEANEIGRPMGAVEFADMPDNSAEFRKYVSEITIS